MSTQAQSKREIIIEKVVEVIKEVSAKEGGITFADLQNLFGKDSRLMATLSNTLRVSF